MSMSSQWAKLPVISAWLSGSASATCSSVASIATQAPHLVHHFFERDHVKDQCPFAASGERSGGLPLEPVAVVATPDVSTPTLPAVFMAPPSGGPTASRGRAPPLRLS